MAPSELRQTMDCVNNCHPVSWHVAYMYVATNEQRARALLYRCGVARGWAQALAAC